jgi:hypothetical protein
MNVVGEATTSAKVGKGLGVFVGVGVNSERVAGLQAKTDISKIAPNKRLTVIEPFIFNIAFPPQVLHISN